jgi:hypothetical protein
LRLQLPRGRLDSRKEIARPVLQSPNPQHEQTRCGVTALSPPTDIWAGHFGSRLPNRLSQRYAQVVGQPLDGLKRHIGREVHPQTRLHKRRQAFHVDGFEVSFCDDIPGFDSEAVKPSAEGAFTFTLRLLRVVTGR